MAAPDDTKKPLGLNEKVELYIEEKPYHLRKMHSKKSVSHSIMCECGAEILVIPDVKEMGRSIESHAEEHRKKEQNPVAGKAAFERVENFLIKQVLEKAALEGSGKE